MLLSCDHQSGLQGPSCSVSALAFSCKSQQAWLLSKNELRLQTPPPWCQLQHVL